METVKCNCTSCTVTPIDASSSNFNETLNETIDVINDKMNSFDECTQEKKEKKAKNYLNSLLDYIKDSSFNEKVNKVANEKGVPPKQVAKNFFEKALGTVGDILGVAINVVCNAGRTVIQVAGTIANGIISLIEKIANGIASIVTFNKTCVQPCNA